MKQAAASAKVKSSYALGLQNLASQEHMTLEEIEKWALLNERCLEVHRNTKELLWHSRRRVSRDFASSEDGLGKYPKREATDE
jgi:hypothetical protein